MEHSTITLIGILTAFLGGMGLNLLVFAYGYGKLSQKISSLDKLETFLIETSGKVNAHDTRIGKIEVICGERHNIDFHESRDRNQVNQR